jgi:TonB family protein
MKTTLALLVLASAPAAFAAAPPADPPLSHEEIKATVDKHLGDVKACLKQHGAATGKLVVKFVINVLGKVESPAPEQSSSNAALDKCIAAQFLKWEFPKPRGNVNMGVVYPFMFAPPPPPPANLSRDQVVATMRAHIADVKICYDAALKQKNDIAGTINVDFTVGPEGKVLDAKVHDSTIKVPALETCLVAKAKTWPFPKPEGVGNFAFTYPFVLTVPPPPKKDKDKDKKDEDNGEME